MILKEKLFIDTQSCGLTNIDFNLQKNILANNGDDGIQLWDINTGQQIVISSSNSFSYFAFSPDGNLLAIDNYRCINLWNLNTKKNIKNILSSHSNYVSFSPNGYILASCQASSSEVNLWQVSSGRKIITLKPVSQYSEEVFGVAFKPNGKTIACYGDSYYKQGKIWLWEVYTGKLIRTITTYGGLDEYWWVSNVSFNHDGSIIAGCSCGYKVFDLWNVDNGEKLITFRGHSCNIKTISFHPSGKIIASGGGDEIKLWDVKTAKEICHIETNIENITSIKFSPDGRLLAGASNDGIIKIWHGNLPHAFRDNILSVTKKQSFTK